jgi:hypothetical protein
MGLQSHKSLNLRNFEIPTWESQDKMTFGCWPCNQAQKILYGGWWWLPQSPSCGESCESMFACGSSVQQKCSNYALTNMLFGFCTSMWIIDLLVTLLYPHPRAVTHPSTPKVLQAKECAPIPCPFIISTLWIHNWVHQKSWGCIIMPIA